MSTRTSTIAAAEGRQCWRAPQHPLRARAWRQHITSPDNSMAPARRPGNANWLCPAGDNRTYLMSRDSDHHIPLLSPVHLHPSSSCFALCQGSSPSPRLEWHPWVGVVREKEREGERECNPQLFLQETDDSLTSAAHYRGNLVSVVFLITRKPMLLLLFIIYMTRQVCALLILA